MIRVISGLIPTLPENPTVPSPLFTYNLEMKPALFFV